MNLVLADTLLFCNVNQQVNYGSISNTLHIIDVLDVQLLYRRYFS